MASPTCALPAASVGATCHTASQAPRHGREGRLVGPHEDAVVAARREGGAASARDVGPEALQRRHPHRGLEHEHAGVPEVAALGEVLLRRGQIGLLDELRDLGAVGADVAVAGFGAVGADAEDDDGAFGRRLHRAPQRGRERGLVGDGLVCRGHHKHRVGTGLQRLQRRQREGRRGVPAHGLEQHGAGLDLHVAQLVEHHEAVLFIADDGRLRHGDGLAAAAFPQGHQAPHGLLEQALRATAEHQKLLRKAAARQRPQARARAAGHHHRPYRRCRLACAHASNPFGLFDCQRQASVHMVARSRVARHPSSCCARDGSAQQEATSPGRRGRIS
jgi:hypothetical protein